MFLHTRDPEQPLCGLRGFWGWNPEKDLGSLKPGFNHERGCHWQPGISVQSNQFLEFLPLSAGPWGRGSKDNGEETEKKGED